MKQPDYARQIEALGWQTECDVEGRMYRATQRGFSTPWVSSWLEVLADVQKLKETAKEEV